MPARPITLGAAVTVTISAFGESLAAVYLLFGRSNRGRCAGKPTMGIETRPWDAAEHLDSIGAVLAYLEAAFEDGDPELIAAALNDVARAKGLDRDSLTAGADLASVIATLKALGLELTAKAA